MAQNRPRLDFWWFFLLRLAGTTQPGRWAATGFRWTTRDDGQASGLSSFAHLFLLLLLLHHFFLFCRYSQLQFGRLLLRTAQPDARLRSVPPTVRSLSLAHQKNDTLQPYLTTSGNTAPARKPTSVPRCCFAVVVPRSTTKPQPSESRAPCCCHQPPTPVVVPRNLQLSRPFPSQGANPHLEPGARRHFTLRLL